MTLPPKVRPYAATKDANDASMQRLFHRWLKAEKLSLSRLRPKQVERFLAMLLSQNLTPTTKAIYRRTFLRYLDWLHRCGFINFNPNWFRPKNRPRNVQLPDVAIRFLNNSKGNGKVVKQPLPSFHNWLNEQHIPLSKLTPEHVERFLTDFSKREAKREAKSCSRSRLLRYLSWLHDEEVILFDPDCLKPEYQKENLLNDDDRRFLQYLRTIRKQSTVSGYRSTLRIFHQWLESNKLTLGDITRNRMTQWFAELMDAGRSASCRAARVIHIRIYFSWLNEEGLLNTNALHLVRASDVPKLPQYLPRPLSPKVDKQLQERLASADTVFHLGLLLMRKTGMRIGELCALPKNCIHRDYTGNTFLKVPLGKLNNERLVPLDHDALALVEKLQKTNDGPLKRWLVEDLRNRKTTYYQYYEALRKTSEGLDSGGKLTPHRLRHTYATSLLNGGMSLVSLMKLLGHRSYRMTLRYAAVTQETIGKEYRNALKQLEDRYDEALPKRPLKRKPVNPIKMLSDVNRWLNSNTPKNTSARREVELIIKRINRIKLDISKLQLS